MLKFDLEKIVERMNNAKRRTIKHEFQELGLFLTEKLQDTPNRPMYMKLAKHEEHELLMSAYSYAMSSYDSNKPKIFLWRLKDLKNTPIDPLSIYLNITHFKDSEGNIYKLETSAKITLFTFENLLRQDYPYIAAGIDYIKEKYNMRELEMSSVVDSVENMRIKRLFIKDNLTFRMRNTLIGIWKEVGKTYNFKLRASQSYAGIPELEEFCAVCKEFPLTFIICGEAKSSKPQLTKVSKQYRIR
jgi:hypothetical protein